jgi:hypothetical protein
MGRQATGQDLADRLLPTCPLPDRILVSRLGKQSGRVKPLRLVGTAEIAAMFGVSSVRAQQLQLKPTFPAPVARLAAGRLYDYDEVVEWARSTGRPLRRPQYDDD